MKLATARKIIAPFVKLKQVEVLYVRHARVDKTIAERITDVTFIATYLYRGRDVTYIIVDDGSLILSGEENCRSYLKRRIEKIA